MNLDMMRTAAETKHAGGPLISDVVGKREPSAVSPDPWQLSLSPTLTSSKLAGPEGPIGR